MSPLSEILVFSQTNRKRVLVGRLCKEKDVFHFAYAKTYAKLKNAVALGPEFPIWKREFSAKTLFPSLRDRIPSRQNPAFKDYCREWGLDQNEKDELLLLATIGSRGPSTFILARQDEENYSGEDLKKFRHRLALNQAEFESLFGVSHLTLVRLEKLKSTNPFYLRCFEIFDRVPQALGLLLKKRGRYLHDVKRKGILQAVRERGRRLTASS